MQIGRSYICVKCRPFIAFAGRYNLVFGDNAVGPFAWHSRERPAFVIANTHWSWRAYTCKPWGGLLFLFGLLCFVFVHVRPSLWKPFVPFIRFSHCPYNIILLYSTKLIYDNLIITPVNQYSYVNDMWCNNNCSDIENNKLGYFIWVGKSNKWLKILVGKSS